MEELAHLVRLEAIVLDEAGPRTFEKAADVSIRLDTSSTPRGRRIAESPKGGELAIEEIG